MLRRGQPFPCSNCQVKLVVPKAAGSAAIAGLMLLLGLSRLMPLWIMAILISGGLILEWLLANVHLAERTASVANPLDPQKPATD